MDLKHKGITWVGNMFQKFEAVCQEVDNIINQDKVKYVENQVGSASENVKKLCSDVVQGLRSPVRDTLKCEVKAAAPTGCVQLNACFKTSLDEGKNANHVHGIIITDQIDNCSQASCEDTFVNEEVAQVSNHSFLKLNADFPLKKNDDVFPDKDLYENMKAKDVNEQLSEKSDNSLADKLTFMESDANDLLLNSLRNASSEINDTNKTASTICTVSDLKLEDDAFFAGNNDVVSTDNDGWKSSEEDTTTTEFSSSNPLKPMVNPTSCQAEVTKGEAIQIQILNDSHLLLESSRFSRKNNNDLLDENSDEFSKKIIIMKPNATDNLNNHLNHVCSDTNFLIEEDDDLNSLLMVELISGRTDRALIDKDFNESLIKDVIIENDPSRNLLILPSQGNGVNFTNEEAMMVSDSNHQQLEPELHARIVEDAFTDKFSNGSIKEDTVLELEHDASYPLKSHTRCTSSCIKYKNEEVSSDSNDYYLKLESEFYCGKNSEALMDKASDASCKEQANFELSTELIYECDEESVKDTSGSRDNECKENFVMATVGPLATSIRGVDVESTHNVRQASSILTNSLVNISQKMETTSKLLENGTSSSNAPDATTSEVVSLVLTSAETVEETRPVSSLKSLPKSSFSASKSFVKNFSSCTVVHEIPADQCASIKYETRPCFGVVASASNENKALKTKFVSSSSSLSSMESLGTHTSRTNESAFLPKLRDSRQVTFSEATSSGVTSLSTEVGRSHNTRCNILDAEMETVDLGHQATLKADCDIVDYKALHAVSRRTQKLRSYRKRIQDAFNSKKRLAKEYEQLAIFYGDIDLELGTNSLQNASASYASDSEWELL